jgi:Mannosyltransferase (PIG-V)
MPDDGWGADDRWGTGAAASGGDRVTPTTGPVTGSGWYADPVEHTDWTTTWNTPARDPLLDDPTSSTHTGWMHDRPQRGRGEEWTGDWHRPTATPGAAETPAPFERDDRWREATDWHDPASTDPSARGIDALRGFPADYSEHPDAGPPLYQQSYDEQTQYNQRPQYDERARYDEQTQYNQGHRYDEQARYDEQTRYDQQPQYDPRRQYDPGPYGPGGGPPAGLAGLADVGPGRPFPPDAERHGRPPYDRAGDPVGAGTAERGDPYGAPGRPTPTQLRPGQDARRRVLGFLQLTSSDLEVLQWWVLTRVAILLVVLTGPSLFLAGDDVPSLLDRWKQWDFWHFDRIATHGYFAPGWDTPIEAFFPGLPMVMRVGTWFGLPTVLVGLLVSFVAGGVAAVALARLAEAEWGEGAGRRAATMWMVAPPAIFLAAPYTESLFLAFAIPAWLAARRGHWWAAGLLAAGASSIRVSGVFLAVALAVEFLTSPKRRDWLSGLWLLAPLAPLLGYMAYLKVNTGDWLRWYHAQSEEWYRRFTSPHEALINTWNAAVGHNAFGDVSEAVRANFAWMFRAELVAMLIGVVVTVILLRMRRWGEATWIGIQVLAFATSYWFFSVPRATLLWFPMWIALAALSFRRPWVWLMYLLLSVPLFGVWAAAYSTGKWAG